jgi:hypothetical protein
MSRDNRAFLTRPVGRVRQGFEMLINNSLFGQSLPWWSGRIEVFDHPGIGDRL